MNLQAHRPVDLAISFAHATSTIVIGWLLLGPIPAGLFSLGFMIGLVLWLSHPSLPTFRSIRVPYFVTLALFVVHKVEERNWGFFPALSKLTGASIAQNVGPLGILLYMLAAAWLLAPWLLSQQKPLGGYLVWSFFASMGVTELAHFIFPLFASKQYGYFPGMLSVVALAPAAWWGMQRLISVAK